MAGSSEVQVAAAHVADLLLLLPVRTCNLDALRGRDVANEERNDWSSDYIDSWWASVHPGWESSYITDNLVLIRKIA